MTEEANKRIGDYQILDELGSGGMGRVWRVRNVITDRIEAMKVLLPDLAGRQELAARFQREIKLMASLNHPNIAALRTAFTADNQLYMVMEYVEGTNLADRLEKGPIAVGDAVNYISQVLSAVSYAHQQHIIHRDIKPANMMLTPQGVIKLMDFGIARGGEERSLTMTGTTMGSLSYMSPEQVKGEATDARSDLYSVGVSLYEFVTGQRPFTATSDYSIMAAHVKEAPKPPVELHPGLPAALNEIILMAIAKDPAQRFQTADAFRNALSSVPVAAPTPAMLEATTVDSMAALPNVPVAPAATPAAAGCSLEEPHGAASEPYADAHAATGTRQWPSGPVYDSGSPDCARRPGGRWNLRAADQQDPCQGAGRELDGADCGQHNTQRHAERSAAQPARACGRPSCWRDECGFVATARRTHSHHRFRGQLECDAIGTTRNAGGPRNAESGAEQFRPGQTQPFPCQESDGPERQSRRYGRSSAGRRRNGCTRSRKCVSSIGGTGADG